MYVLVIHTDVPKLTFDFADDLLCKHFFKNYTLINRAFLLMSFVKLINVVLLSN